MKLTTQMDELTLGDVDEHRGRVGVGGLARVVAGHGGRGASDGQRGGGGQGGDDGGLCGGLQQRVVAIPVDVPAAVEGRKIYA